MAEKTTNTDNPLVYDVAQAAALLGMSRNAAYAAAARGDIPTIRIGKLIRVPKVALDRLIDGASGRRDHAR
ncbi:helix-turn-helix domain-containing protein [Rhodoplanes sp. SY1]|uniref:helix-turn-helix domain-containing protein n=1 Tax=Rhodoplanes sp. SY1 TaxID=3166646 RepID=UPI0038B5F493